MSVDFSRWAVVAYNDDTGLGTMARDAKAVLGVRQIVIPSLRLESKPLEAGRDVLLRPDAPVAEVEAALAGLRGLILLEKYAWHPELVATAKRLGVRLVVVPMWEWFRGQDRDWEAIDLLACPFDHCLKIVRGYGWRQARRVTWTLDLARFPSRSVRGSGRYFFHNAGLIDDDDRKGTRDTIRAFLHVPRRDIRLIVRMQRAAPLPETDERIEVQVGNVADPAALYAQGDVAIQPSKLEGVGFMVLEPVCCGIPTLATDFPPMSDYVAQPELRVRQRWRCPRGFPWRVAGVRHARLRLPRERDLARRIEWCAAHDLGEVSRANRAWAEAEFDPVRLRAAWSEALAPLT